MAAPRRALAVAVGVGGPPSQVGRIGELVNRLLQPSRVSVPLLRLDTSEPAAPSLPTAWAVVSNAKGGLCLVRAVMTPLPGGFAISPRWTDELRAFDPLRMEWVPNLAGHQTPAWSGGRRLALLCTGTIVGGPLHVGHAEVEEGRADAVLQPDAADVCRWLIHTLPELHRGPVPLYR